MNANNAAETHLREVRSHNKKRGSRMNANNVIDFPSSIPHQELRQATIDDVEIVADTAVAELIETLHHYGYMIEEVKDIGLMYETVKSSLLRCVGVDHFLQQVSNKYIQLKD